MRKQMIKIHYMNYCEYVIYGSLVRRQRLQKAYYSTLPDYNNTEIS